MRLPRPRFSLRTLVVFLLLATSGVGLWSHWGPWALRWEFAEPHHGGVSLASFSADGKALTTIDRGLVARRWDLVQGRRQEKLAHPESLLSGDLLALREGSFLFFQGGRRHFAAVADALTPADGERDGKQAVFGSGESKPSWAAISPDERRVATIALNGVHLWDAGTGAHLAKLPHHGGRMHAGAMWVPGTHGLTFSPNSSLLLSCGEDNAARLWRAEDGGLVAELGDHRADVDHASFSSDSRLVVTASYDRTARVWEAEAGRCLGQLEGHLGPVYRASFSASGSRIVTGASDGVRVWAWPDGRCLQALRVDGRGAQYVALSEEADLLVAGTGNWEGLVIFRRRRPERWWGVFYLWEFWLTAAFAALFVWSVVGDRRALGGKEAA